MNPHSISKMRWKILHVAHSVGLIHGITVKPNRPNFHKIHIVFSSEQRDDFKTNYDWYWNTNDCGGCTSCYIFSSNTAGTSGYHRVCRKPNWNSGGCNLYCRTFRTENASNYILNFYNPSGN